MSVDSHQRERLYSRVDLTAITYDMGATYVPRKKWTENAEVLLFDDASITRVAPGRTKKQSGMRIYGYVDSARVRRREDG
jgi:hypothetical protein